MNPLYSRSLLLCLFLLPALPSPAGAEVYRWTDAEGKVHFGDRKPEDKGAGAVESFQGKGAVSFIDSPPATEGAVSLRMFTTQWCPTCKKAKAWLKQRGTPFVELDIEASASARAEYQKAGGKGVPLILLGHERMSGFDANRLETMLGKAGYPPPAGHAH